MTTARETPKSPSAQSTSSVPSPLSFSSGFNIVVHAIGFLFVYALFYLRDWANRSHSLAARMIGWLLSGFYKTGAYMSSDFEHRWGTHDELLGRFHGNEKMPRLELSLRVRRDD